MGKLEKQFGEDGGSKFGSLPQEVFERAGANNDVTNVIGGKKPGAEKHKTRREKSEAARRKRKDEKVNGGQTLNEAKKWK